MDTSNDLSGKMILHINFWQKSTGTIEQISFVIDHLEDWKPIAKSLRSKGLKIKQISVHVPFNQEKSK